MNAKINFDVRIGPLLMLNEIDVNLLPDLLKEKIEPEVGDKIDLYVKKQ